MSRGSTEHRQKRLISARSRLRSFENSCHSPDQSSPKVTSPSPAPAEVEPNASVAIARLLAVAAESLGACHPLGEVADFLLRCAFTMFLSSVDVIPPRALTCAVLTDTLAIMWTALFGGSPTYENIECRDALLTWDSPESRTDVAHGIFATMTALPLDGVTKQALVDADACNWSGVDLSIFGALVEGSFDPKQRHRLGAHYTPREYVMQLVGPTIEEPMRQEWEEARSLSRASPQPLLEFHKKLCVTRVLDPACGTGNFLICALETLYAIEDDVLREFDALGLARPVDRVTPHQMLGIEINPRACQVCKLVLNMCDLRRKHTLSGGRDGSRPE